MSRLDIMTVIESNLYKTVFNLFVSTKLLMNKLDAVEHPQISKCDLWGQNDACQNTVRSPM